VPTKIAAPLPRTGNARITMGTFRGVRVTSSFSTEMALVVFMGFGGGAKPSFYY